ncbi:hypothetical protein TeGR_g1328, partial [Tetraparma gracilis]
MVEFGLKLDDNTVAKWKPHYINYEKLKALLKAAKAALKARDALADKMRAAGQDPDAEPPASLPPSPPPPSAAHASSSNLGSLAPP